MTKITIISLTDVTVVSTTNIRQERKNRYSECYKKFCMQAETF